MKKIIWTIFAGLILVSVSTLTSATNLLTVYHQALANDPTFQQAAASMWLNGKDYVPLARANLLPSFDANGVLSRNHSKSSLPGTEGYDNSQVYTLTLTQPLLNFSNWYQLQGAHYKAKAGEATYAAAAQDLMSRTAGAYFDVLTATDTLQNDIAQKNAYAQTLKTNKQKYKVGLIAITDVYSAQANYDTSVATIIGDQNNLQDKLEALRAITNHLYPRLNALAKQVPLITPQPNNINQWVKSAAQQNYSLKAALFTTLYDRSTIKKQAAGRYPTLSLQGGYTRTLYSDAPPVLGLTADTRVVNAGITLDFPVYQGGLVSAQTRQAMHQYQFDDSQYKINYRSTVQNTRSDFLGVISDISIIKADNEAIISAANALKADQAGYLVGTKTIQDVLNDIQGLYKAKTKYSTDQYAYIKNTISLKQDTSTLSISDLQKINTWLTRPISFATLETGGTQKSKKISTRKKSYKTTKKRSSKKTPRANLSKKTSPTFQQYLKSHYAIQFYAAANQQEAQAFINNLPNRFKFRVVKTSYGNKTWYKVVYGSYTTHSAAEEALKGLTANYQKLKPWVTPLPSKSTTTSKPTTTPTSTLSTLPPPVTTTNGQTIPSASTTNGQTSAPTNQTTQSSATPQQNNTHGNATNGNNNSSY